MDHSWIGSIDIALKKAFTSRAFDIEPKTWQSMLSQEASSSVFMRQTMARYESSRRHPAEADGKVVGAIGVSGGSGDQDHAVATAGAAAF